MQHQDSVVRPVDVRVSSLPKLRDHLIKKNPGLATKVSNSAYRRHVLKILKEKGDKVLRPYGSDHNIRSVHLCNLVQGRIAVRKHRSENRKFEFQMCSKVQELSMSD